MALARMIMIGEDSAAAPLFLSPHRSIDVGIAKSGSLGEAFMFYRDLWKRD